MQLPRRFPATMLALLCALVPAGPALAQSAQLAHVEGSVALSAHGDKEWMEVRAARELRQGDRLWVDPQSRLELKAGRHLLRLDARSHLAIDSLKPAATQVSLRQGSVLAQVPALGARENFEIDTPNLAFRATAPGRFRVDVDAQRGVTQVSVLEGRGTVFGAKGEQRPLQAGQDMAFAGTALAIAAPVRSGPPDGLARWALTRDRAHAPAAVARAPSAAPPGAVRAPGQATHAARAPAPRSMGAGPPRAAEGQARAIDAQEEARERAEAQARRAQQQRRREELAQREAWLRQRRAAEEAYWRQQQEWLRYQHGGPPPASAPHYPLTPRGGIPARRVG